MTSLLLVVVRAESRSVQGTLLLTLSMCTGLHLLYEYILITFVLSLFKIAIYKYFKAFLRQTGLP